MADPHWIIIIKYKAKRGEVEKKQQVYRTTFASKFEALKFALQLKDRDQYPGATYAIRKGR